MNRYVVRTPFKASANNESRVMRKGEAIRLSSSSSAQLVARGLIIEKNIGLDLLNRFEARIKTLQERLGYSQEDAQIEAAEMVKSCLMRHESLKHITPPSDAFLEEVDEFNRNATGGNPITKVDAENGVGEWAGYRCNIGQGCSHGCLYCYAEKMATRFNRVVDATAWREENLRDISTEGCKKYDSSIMFPTTHDITPPYLPAYKAHLYNILNAGNAVVVVSKPHIESIQAICTEFSAFRDNITLRFTIGGLDEEVMRHWEPGAPPLPERLSCLRHGFEYGYRTSVSAEPMLGGREEAERLYYLLEPFVTEDIWFGKMNRTGGLRNSQIPEVATRATELLNLQNNADIIELVDNLNGLPKVKWKDSIKEVIDSNS